MVKLFRKFWADEAGFIISAELVLVITIMVIGLVAGLSTMRDALLSEMMGISGALTSLNQSYRIPAVIGPNGTAIAGSQFVDYNTLINSAQPNKSQDKSTFDGVITPLSFSPSDENDRPLVENNVYVSNYNE